IVETLALYGIGTRRIGIMALITQPRSSSRVLNRLVLANVGSIGPTMTPEACRSVSFVTFAANRTCLSCGRRPYWYGEKSTSFRGGAPLSMATPDSRKLQSRMGILCLLKVLHVAKSGLQSGSALVTSIVLFLISVVPGTKPSTQYFWRSGRSLKHRPRILHRS